MSSITFGGLATGMDTGAIISELMKIERQPLDRLEREKKFLTSRLDAFKNFDKKLADLHSFFKDFDTSTKFRSFTASAATTDFFTLSANSTAVKGSFQVEVQSLARIQKDVSIDGYSSRSTADFSAGTVTINGTDIAIAENDSLNDIAAKINAANTGDTATGISASIINDGSADGYRIVLTGKDAASTFTAVTTGVSSGGTALSFSTTQAAGLASIKVDGIIITSKNNTFTEAIPGVTLSLLKANELDTATTVAVDTNTDAIKGKLNDFIKKYNDILSFIDAQKDADWGKDSGFQNVKRNLQKLLVTNVGNSGTVNHLVDLGIKTDQSTGKISLDSSKADDLIANNFADLEKLFLGEEGVDGISTLFKNYLGSATNTANGIYASKKSGTDRGIRSFDNNIARMELRLEQREKTLRAQFSAMEQLVSGMNSTASYLSQQMNMLARMTPGAR